MFLCVFDWRATPTQRAFRRVRGALEELRRLFPLRSIETISTELLEQAKEQNAQLARFNTDFAVSIAAALENRLNESLVPPITLGMGRVVTAIEAMKDDRSQSTDEVLTRALDSFKESLNASAGTEMDSVRQTFGQIDTALQSVIAGLADVELVEVDSGGDHAKTGRRALGDRDTLRGQGREFDCRRHGTDARAVSHDHGFAD